MTAWTIAVLGITFLTLWAGSALLPLEGQPLASVARLVYLGMWVGWLLMAVRLGSLCHGWRWWRRHKPRLQYEERTDCATSCMIGCQATAEIGADPEEVAAVLRGDPRAVKCTACSGTGHVRDDNGNWMLCGGCLGNGIVRPREGFNPPPADEIPPPPEKTPAPSGPELCTRCNGTGRVADECPVCGGMGKVRVEVCDQCGGSGGGHNDNGVWHSCCPCEGTGKIRTRIDHPERTRPCTRCGGTGKLAVWGPEPIDCGTCNGTGRVAAE